MSDGLDQAKETDVLARLRAENWTVAVHNDYRLNGKAMTFWLLTHPCGRYTKGEGATDAEALEAAWVTRPRIEYEPFIPTDAEAHAIGLGLTGLQALKDGERTLSPSALVKRRGRIAFAAVSRVIGARLRGANDAPRRRSANDELFAVPATREEYEAFAADNAKAEPVRTPVAAGLARRRKHFCCAGCGEHVAADEDGCCAACGSDTTVTTCECMEHAASVEVSSLKSQLAVAHRTIDVRREGSERIVSALGLDDPDFDEIVAAIRKLSDERDALAAKLAAHHCPSGTQTANEIVEACVKAWNENIQQHDDGATCPTWYDGCHCRSDKRIDSAIRALKGRFTIAPGAGLTDEQAEAIGLAAARVEPKEEESPESYWQRKGRAAWAVRPHVATPKREEGALELERVYVSNTNLTEPHLGAWGVVWDRAAELLAYRGVPGTIDEKKVQELEVAVCGVMGHLSDADCNSKVIVRAVLAALEKPVAWAPKKVVVTCAEAYKIGMATVMARNAHDRDYKPGSSNSAAGHAAVAALNQVLAARARDNEEL